MFVDMKKVLIVCLAALAFACDSADRSSERDAEMEEQAPLDAADNDDASIHSDTTTSGGMNRQNQYDTLKQEGRDLLITDDAENVSHIIGFFCQFASGLMRPSLLAISHAV